MNTRSLLQMRGMPVFTEQHIKLGTVRDIIIDADSGRIFQFVIRTRLLGGAELLISFDAIIEIRDEAVIVKDTVVPNAAPALA